MDRNDSPAGENRTPFKRRGSHKDMLAHLSNCIRGVDKENMMSSAEKHFVGSDDFEKASGRFGTPDSIVAKAQDLSPRKTTCDKKKELSESPAHCWRIDSSAKRERRFGHTPASIFHDSTEKKPTFVDYQVPSALNEPDLTSEKGALFLQELDPPLFMPQMMSPVKTGYYVEEASQRFNIFLKNPDSGVGIYQSREHRGRAEPGKCNCRNSQCLKMYCDCLKRGEYCVGCNCVGCENHPDSDERKKKVGGLFEKSKKAAGGLVVTSAEELKLKVMKNGCNCRKNSCLKKYCECHQFGLRCGKACRCLTCQNGREEAPSD